MTRVRVVSLVAAASLCVSVLPATQASAETATTCTTTTTRPVDADRTWAIASQRLSARVGPATLPLGATGSSRYVRTSAYAWTSGFFPASLWRLYEHTGSRVWLARARAYTKQVLPVARWRGSHDLGFMVGLPAGLGRRLDPTPSRRTAYAVAMRQAARSLSTRWNGNVGAIRSARYDGKWGLIVDSAMNVPLLIEVGQQLGGDEGRRLEARGRQHLLTLARTFVRPDGSTFHRQAFDPRTGRLLGPIFGQGLSTTSTWARGQAWAVNGFTRGYQLTDDARLLDAARKTADHWISRVPAGCVPAWDLDVVRVRSPRDSSAAAIVVDGLLALAEVDPDASRAAGYREYALATLGALTSAPWVANRGRGLLQRQTYNVPADRREGTYAWGDAYLLSALSRVSQDGSVQP